MKTNILKKAASIFAVAALAFALTNVTAAACGGAAGCKASKNTQASANGKAACTASQASKTGKSCSMAGKKCTSATTTASADASGAKMMMADSKNCPLANGTYSVAAYKVEGLTCGGCEINLTNAFEAADGVVMVPTVSYTDGSAKVIYDPKLTNPEALTKVISGAGYKGEIVPAVAVTTGSSDKNKAACSAKGATANANNANGSATCPHATKGANATTASAAGCSSACSQLTSAEREAFCNKFCKSHKTSEKKSDKKSKDI